MKLQSGSKAPEFSLPDQEGQMHSLKDYAGQWVLLYFYPKDDTPGCTLEACSIRDNWTQFKRAGITVLGVSADTVAKHEKFSKKYKLPFTLLADEAKKVVKQYGVYGEKKFMGRTYMGIFRNSFLIDPRGKIVKIYEAVKPTEHAAEVLADVKQLS
jgi:peroxiredoxin Q/BCP